MKRSSSEAVADNNAWNEVQQEPLKKAKSEVVVQIEPAVQNPSEGENGHQNGHQNGRNNGDAKNGLGGPHEMLVTLDEGYDPFMFNGGHLDDVNHRLEEEIGQLQDENAIEDGQIIILQEEEVVVEIVDTDEATVVVETEDVVDYKDQNELNAEEETEDDDVNLKMSDVEDEPEEKEKIIVPEVQQAMPTKTLAKEGTWDQHKLQVSELHGHAHKINSVDLSESHLVSASDDTTVKVWDVESKKEICTLSGHKEAVKAVQILELAASREICEEGGFVVISGSTDCFAKFWHIPSGKELKSIYTYNPITCVGYIPQDSLLVTATDGGKLELFDAIRGTHLHSVHAFELPVVSMKVSGGTIICGDSQSRLQLYVVKDKKLCCRRSSNGMETSRPNLSSIAFYGTDNIIASFLSGSVKKMNWINGSVNKIRCGNGDQVDSMQVVNELMVITTSMEEKSFMHFYNLPTGMYLGSAPGTHMMESVALARKEGLYQFATGGEKLQLWQSAPHMNADSDDGVLISVLPQSETSAEDSDSEDEDAENSGQKESTGLLGNCCVM